MQYVDLTHTFKDDMPVYPGDPKSELKQITSIEKEGFVDHQIRTAMHVGTHIDAPLHMLEDGKKITDYTPDKFFGTGVLVDVRGKFKIEAADLPETLPKGGIVFLLTGFEKKFGTHEYYTAYPSISIDAAEKIAAAEVSILGMDIPSPDYPPYETHKILLRKDILIIENLTNLHALLGAELFKVVALPAKLDTEAAPVRVVALVD